MKTLALILLLAGSATLSAQYSPPDASIGRNIPGSVPTLAPDQVARDRSAIEEKPESPKVPTVGKPGSGVLRKIVFSGALSPQDQRAGIPLGGGGVLSDRVDLIEQRQFFVMQLERKYLGQPFTAKTVEAINEDALQFYLHQERPLVFIQPLAINYKSGEVKFLVIEAKLDQKTGVGARWFSNKALANNLRVRSGQYINRMQLLNDLAWINQNPFLGSRVVLNPGSVPGTTSIELETKDSFPVRVFGSVDNTGSEQTGPWRWTLGANWGNALFLGHQLNYQFSAAFEDIYSQPVHAVSYIAPLPWHHTFSLYGSYAGTDIDIDTGTDQALNYSGYQAQVSPRYTIPIGRLYGRFTHEFTAGFDWKSSDLSYLQGGDSIPSNKTNVCQFMAGYNASLTDDWGVTTLGFEMYWSPGGMGGLNTDSAFEAVDPRLQADYLYGVLRLGRTTKLPWGLSFVQQFSGQFASTSLISSEQLSIGGWGTVRGYDERVLFGDQGFVINTELRSPAIPLLTMINESWMKDQFQVLAFWDLGLVNTINPLPGDDANYYLTSVGVGARYSLANNLSVRCDVGFPLVNPDLGFEVEPRVCFGATLGF